MEINFDFSRYDKISGIYFIKCLENGKMYIGSSVNILTRLECHRSELRGNYHGNHYMQNCWNKYGEDKFICGLIEKINNIEMLLEREQYYINQLNPKLNLCFDVKRHSFTEESKKKLSEKRKALFKSGKLRPSVMRPVNRYDLLGNFIETYESITDAARKFGCHVSSIERCVYGIDKQNKGFVFRYIEDGPPKKIVNKKGHIIKMVDIQTNTETIFPSVSKCCLYFGKGSCNHEILKSIKNKKLYRDRFALYKLDELLEKPEEVNQQLSLS